MNQREIPDPDIKSFDFIGREEIMGIIDDAINREGNLRVVNIQGVGGIGKTSVLRKVRKEYHKSKENAKDSSCSPEGALQEKEILVTGIIDFFDVATHTAQGFMYEVYQELKPGNEDLFRPLEEVLGKYNRFKLAGVTSNILDEARDDVIKKFDECYSKLASDKRVVILIDTFELVQHIIGAWLAKWLVKRSNTTVIIAGRKNKAWHDTLVEAVGKTTSKYYELNEFNEDDAEQLFELSGAGKEIDEEERQQLQILSGGRPILLAMAIDFQERHIPPNRLTNATAKYPLAELKNKSEDELEIIRKEFCDELVHHFIDLKPHHNAITHMAVAYKYFTPELLAFLMGKEEVEDAQDMLSKLADWTFIKFNNRLNSYQLHDLVRDMVLEFVWPKIDPTGKMWKKTCEKTAKYYNKLIEELKNKQTRYYQEKKIFESKNDKEKESETVRKLFTLKKVRQYREIQQVYYDIVSDHEGGIIRYSFLFADFVWAREREAYELIRKERDEACEMLGLEYPEEKKRLEDARIKIVAEGKVDEGLKLLENLLKDLTKKYNLNFYADILLYRSIGYNFKGEKTGQDELIVVLKKLEDKLKSLPETNRLEMLRIARTLGRAYGHLGYRYFSSGRYSESEKPYKDSLRYSRVGKLTSIATVSQNDLSYVYARLGNCRLGRNLCKEALKIREELQIQYFIGLSYNTLGQIEYLDDDPLMGEKYCRKALSIFERIGDTRGRMLAHRALGANLSRIGVKEESFAKLRESEKNLTKAIEIAKKPEPRYLVETYQYLGLLYQNWALLLRNSVVDSESVSEYFQKAEENFQRSIDQAIIGKSKWNEAYARERLFSMYSKGMNDVEKSVSALQEVENVLSYSLPECYFEAGNTPKIPSAEIRHREQLYLLGKMLRGRARIAFMKYINEKDRKLLEDSAINYTLACAYIGSFSREASAMGTTLEETVSNVSNLTFEESKLFRDQIKNTIDQYGLNEYSTIVEWIDSYTGLI